MTQDEKWEKEEHLMLNWVKQQRKLLNAGKLKEDRVGRFLGAPGIDRGE